MSTMAPVRLAGPPTCLSCLRRLAQPSPSTFSLRPLAQQQTRGAKMAKAEQEDVQGIPVRLLCDMPGFGPQEAIIRVKRGRMRNKLFPKGQAEYMTEKRFRELGLNESAIGTRDRTYGAPKIVEEHSEQERSPKGTTEKKSPPKETLVLSPNESLTLIQTYIPGTLTFTRKPILVTAPVQAEPAPEPAPVRSPSLARHAVTSVPSPAPAPAPKAEPSVPTQTSIFGSVSAHDILVIIKEKLIESDPEKGARIALDESGITIVGLGEGEDRIKHLGTFKVSILVAADLRPFDLDVEVVAEE
ncbi:hypothetical protein F5B19DRAFT_466616 [Rostrohypoxylon terebratum]|nr:hypothetical protein F5B19DRAFT_466616 [Rostrohypoxylon terebratum]